MLTRDSPKTDPASSFNSLLGDIALRVEDILAEAFKRQHLPAKGRAILRADAHRHDRIYLPVLGGPAQTQ